MRNYPNLLAVDPENCGCTECLTGEYVPQSEFIQNAKLEDVKMLIAGQIGNHTYFSDNDLLQLVIAQSPEESVRELRVELPWNTCESTLGDVSRSFPDVLAVDPEGCGCTECMTGEYVPLERFVMHSEVGDVLALLSEEVGNNTYTLDHRHLVEEVISRSDNPDIKELGRRLGVSFF